MSTPKWGNYASRSALLASEKITEDDQSSISTATDKALGQLFRSRSEWHGRQGSFLGGRKRGPVGPLLNFAVCGYALRSGLALCTRRPRKTRPNSTDAGLSSGTNRPKAQGLEGRCEVIGETPDRSRLKLRVLQLEVQVVHCARQVLRSFQFALNEPFINNYVRGDIGEFRSLR